MKKINLIGICLVLGLAVLFSCAKKEEPDQAVRENASRSLRIGYSTYTLRGPYFSAVDNTLKNYAKENDWNYISTDAENNAEKQISDVEDMLARGLDYLVLNPKDPDSGIRIVKNAQKQNVPVITIDSDIRDDAPVVSRVLSPNFEGNKEMGRYVASNFGQTHIQMGMIDGEKGNLVTMARINGFIQGIIGWQLDNLGRTNFTINGLLYTAWDAEGGVRGSEDLLSAYGDKLNLIYVTTDDMARGAIRAMTAANKLGDIKVAGFDGSNAGIELVAKGDYFATSLNSPRLMVGQVLDIIYKMETGQTIFPARMSYDPVVITKDNASEYIGKGF